MQLFEGLLFYEIVLLVLGVLLFLVTLFALVYSIIKKRDLKALALFFVISIIMIGYPSIQKIKFDNGVVEVEKRTQELAQNPADITAKKELQKSLIDIVDRPTSNPTTLVKFAEAQVAVGDTTNAEKNLNLAMKENPDLPQAKRLKSNIYMKRPEVERMAK